METTQVIQKQDVEQAEDARSQKPKVFDELANAKHSSSRPENNFRAGALSSTIWKNRAQKDGRSFETHSVVIARGYKNKQGEWQNSSSFRAQDLPQAALLLQEAYKFLVMTGAEINSEE